MWKNDKKWPVLSRDQAKPLIEDKQIKRVSLYEPDHAPWKEFMWVEFDSKRGRIPYRWMPGKGSRPI